MGYSSTCWQRLPPVRDITAGLERNGAAKAGPAAARGAYEWLRGLQRVRLPDFQALHRGGDRGFRPASNSKARTLLRDLYRTGPHYHGRASPRPASLIRLRGYQLVIADARRGGAASVTTLCSCHCWLSKEINVEPEVGYRAA